MSTILSSGQADQLAGPVHGEPGAGVDDVHAIRAVGLHQLRLLCRAVGPARWLIIMKPDTTIPSSRAVVMCSAEPSPSVQWVAAAAASRITKGPGVDVRLELMLLLDEDGTLLARWSVQRP
jgi:hypothetical protein